MSLYIRAADHSVTCAVVSTLLLAACSSITTGTVGPVLPVSQLSPGAATPGSGGTQSATGAPAAVARTASVPHCAKPIDSVALVEKADGSLAQMGLTSPLPILRMMISQSNCFTIVDRGAAFEAIASEQKISGTAGKGKLIAARYIITPQIVFQNQGSTPIGSALSPFMNFLPTSEVSSAMGAVAGNVNHTMTSAQTILFLTDARTGTQVAAASGSAQTSEIGFVNAGLGNILGAQTAYATTDTGKAAAAAMLDAYANLVAQVSQQQALAQ